MRYVSSIVDIGGLSLDSFEYELTVGYSHNVTVSDTNRLIKPVIGVNAVNAPCLGAGINFESNTGIMVTHTKKTALFHKYVNLAETRIGVTPFEYKESNVCKLHGGVVEFTPSEESSSGILEVWLENHSISCYGPSGSVVLWQSSGVVNRAICTLYDMFVYICREIGINLLQYETIQFCSRKRLWQTIIRLVHTKEAERFFTKMCVDVAGAYAGRLSVIESIPLWSFNTGLL